MRIIPNFLPVLTRRYASPNGPTNQSVSDLLPDKWRNNVLNKTCIQTDTIDIQTVFMMYVFRFLKQLVQTSLSELTIGMNAKGWFCNTSSLFVFGFVYVFVKSGNGWRFIM